MFAFKVNQKGEVKKSFQGFLDALARGDLTGALGHLSAFEERLCQHLLLRGDPRLVGEVRERCRRIRIYLLDPSLDSRDRSRLVLGHVEGLRRALGGESRPTLEEVYRSLREDWADFWSSPSEGALSAIKDDLDDLGELEPEMRGRTEGEYRKYREALTRRGKCYTVLPYMAGMARGVSLPDAQRKQVFECFSQLFESLEALMAPYKLEYEEVRLEPVAREEE